MFNRHFEKKGSSSVWWCTRGIYCCYITLRAHRVTEFSHQIIAFSFACYLSNYSTVNLITSGPSFSAKSVTRINRKSAKKQMNVCASRRTPRSTQRYAQSSAWRATIDLLFFTEFFDSRDELLQNWWTARSLLEIIKNNFILLNDVDIFNEIITRLVWCVFFVSWGVSFREYGVKATTPATPWITLV